MYFIAHNTLCTIGSWVGVISQTYSSHVPVIVLKVYYFVTHKNDGWSSTATQSFKTHTVHFINGKWELVSGVLETGVFSGSHTAERLVQDSQKVVSDFDIVFDSVVAVTHDEAANTVAAGRCLYEECGWHSDVCMAHRLQTSVRHAMDMKEVTKVLACSRSLLGISNSPALPPKPCGTSKFSLPALKYH